MVINLLKDLIHHLSCQLLRTSIGNRNKVCFSLQLLSIVCGCYKKCTVVSRSFENIGRHSVTGCINKAGPLEDIV